MKKVSLVMVVALSILFGACKKEAPGNLEYQVSIMSFNIRYDTSEDEENQWSNRKEACIKMLKEYQPSVFGIQEGLEHQVAYFDEELKNYEFVGVGRDDGDYSGEYNAIFYETSRFELLEDSTFWLSETPSYPSYGWDAACKRVVSYVKLYDLDYDQELYVFNTHFDHEGKKAREESGKMIVKQINKLTSETIPVFIAGDFNALRSNSIMEPIEDAFSNTRKEAVYGDRTKTFNGFGKWYLPHTNIDHLYYRNATADSYRTINDDFGVDYISDHYPIIGKYHYGELMIN
jgi:endonuclease/exonuclease/phosphatase family metal-dependent hydrolase